MEVWGGSETEIVHADGMCGYNFRILAIPSGSKLVTYVKLSIGRWLVPEDANAVVLNQMVLNKEPGTKVGHTITLRINGKDSSWKVVVVVQEIMSQPKAYVNQEYFQKLTGQKGFGQNVIITTGNKD